ncbi:MAG TPA: UDP-N-acetylmuramate--L-alanine ligase [Thermoanaerobaculia bacterium]|jgi:UDP-N-acetylmuramate--alanine ligase
MNFDQIRAIHFVGIGGIGMSGIAEILAEAGVSVSGCDLKPSAATDLLRSRGISVVIGHDREHLEGIDLVVVTAAVKGTNDEVDQARRRGIRILRRAEMLGEIVRGKRSVGIAGTHGKTTTSAMVATVLSEAGLDPTVLIGGMVGNFGGNAKRGNSDLVVVEADEYDRTFHELHPQIAVVTNIEADHLEYYGSFEAIEEAFRVYAESVAQDGVVIGCIDDPAVASLLEFSSRRTVRYGLSETAEVRAVNITYEARGSRFEVPGVGFFKLFIPGEHNVRNALAAIAVARELGIDGSMITLGLAKFLGVDRRFQLLGEYSGALIVDDYAHHPTEIRATLDAARRGYPTRRLIALFQPHLYSRTRDFADDFARALKTADVALVAPIYAAREKPIEGISARMIANAESGIEFLDRSNSEIYNEMRRRLEPNDIFITMGAGDVHEIAEMLVRGAA